jgi:hypothetical protein
MTGVPEAKEYKFSFEVLAKEAGKAIEEAGQVVETTLSEIVTDEVKKIVMEDEVEDDERD